LSGVVDVNRGFVRSTGGERWLFLLHVDWRWIRQRPHWFAEEATLDRRVMVAYRLHPGRRGLPRNSSGVRRFPMLPLPLGRSLQHRRVARIFAGLQRIWLGLMTRRFNPTHVYVSHPKVFRTLPRGVRRRGVIVYDCMDDAIAMAAPGAQASLLELERELVEAADLVVVSSAVLLARLESRYGSELADNVHLVRNGLRPPSAGLAFPPPSRPQPTRVVVGYTGTVARWFDFDSVLYALDACSEVSMRVIGPRTGTEPGHARIEYVAPVAHDELPGLLHDCDALIMPFKPDAIVTAVNPVKLYEYLTYGVPVIAARYGEVEEQFGRFVEMYDSPEGLADLFRALSAGRLQVRGDREQLQEFITASTWENRWHAVRLAVAGAQP
jgi:teichuronic acid biosynthesis glycosyltransferase TuaH